MYLPKHDPHNDNNSRHVKVDGGGGGWGQLVLNSLSKSFSVLTGTRNLTILLLVYLFYLFYF